MFRVAIIGCGAIAQIHANALLRLKQIQVVGCGDIELQRAQALAEPFQCPAFSSLEDLLETTQPDVLHICTPHHLHVPMALEAAKRGIAVLCEKPEGISLEQLDALAKAEEQGGIFGICFQNRYNEGVKQARKLLQSGETGKLLGVRAFVTWKRDKAYYAQSNWRGHKETEGGGVMINQAIHTLDLLQYLCGYPKTLQGHVDNYHLQQVIDVEDTAIIHMTLPQNIPALMMATTAFAVDSAVLLELVCENMSLRLEGDTLKVYDIYGHKQISQTLPQKVTIGKPCWGTGHLNLFEDFYHCLATKTPFSINAKEGAKAVQLLLALYESSKTGQPITL